MRIWKRTGLVASLAAIAVVGVVGCGSSSSSSSSSTASSTTASSGSAGATTGADASVVKLIPAAIKSKGTITVASDASYAPNEFIGSDGHTVVGMDPDLMQALGKVMGLKVNVVNQTFDSIIPGLTAG